jgi:hypothetical protein
LPSSRRLVLMKRPIHVVHGHSKNESYRNQEDDSHGVVTQVGHWLPSIPAGSIAIPYA